MTRSATPVEYLKGRVYFTGDGAPADLATVQSIYGSGASPAPERGWFWIPTTPKAAANIRAHGHNVVGTLTTTVIPPDEVVRP